MDDGAPLPWESNDSVVVAQVGGTAEPSESGVPRPENDGRRERRGVCRGEGEVECEDDGLRSVRCNCAVSSASDCCGGKGGQALRLIACFDDCGAGAGEGEGDRDARGTRLWTMCGIVEMRGDSAHGFVFEARSCSNVGSTKLTEQ